MKSMVKSFSSLVIIAFIGILSLTADARAPECKIMEVTDQNGNTCWVCVVLGDGANCQCGGKLCFE